MKPCGAFPEITTIGFPLRPVCLLEMATNKSPKNIVVASLENVATGFPHMFCF